MKKLLGGLAIIFVLTGCGHAVSTNQAVKTPTVIQPTGTTWIQLDDMNHGGYYVVTTEPVQKVGQLIGTVCLACNGPTPMSNNLPSGTKIYQIPEVSTEKEIAFETSDGHYLKAVWYGTKEP